MASVPQIVLHYWIALCNAIWKRLDFPSILRLAQSLSEKALVLINPLKRVIQLLGLQLNMQVQGVQVPLAPKP